MFDLGSFVSERHKAVTDDPAHKAVSEIVKRAASDPSSMLEALGEPTEPGNAAVYSVADLTMAELA